jgi:hypothetical protein
MSEVNKKVCHVMAQAICYWLLTLIQFQVSPREICGGPSATGTGLSPTTSVFPFQYHSTNAPHLVIHLSLTLHGTGLAADSVVM